MLDIAVRTADRDDRASITAVFGRAFPVDPVYRWLFPDPQVRARRTGPLIGTMLRHLHHGTGPTEVALLEGAIVGAAAWDRPGAALFHLGVDPDHQRGGAGGALLRSMLERCDTDSAPAYLECCDANVAYYEHFGFAVRDTVVVDDGLSCRTMWREPMPRPSEPSPA